jgi:hypothetical protein
VFSTDDVIAPSLLLLIAPSQIDISYADQTEDITFSVTDDRLTPELECSLAIFGPSSETVYNMSEYVKRGKEEDL